MAMKPGSYGSMYHAAVSQFEEKSCFTVRYSLCPFSIRQTELVYLMGILYMSKILMIFSEVDYSCDDDQEIDRY